MLLMVGCVEEESNKREELFQTTKIPVEESNEQLVNTTVSTVTYKIGDLIMDEVESKEHDYNKSDYYFGGYIDGVFVINVGYDKETQLALGFAFYYPTRLGLEFTLPMSNITLKVIDFDIEQGTIEFQKL